MTAGIHGGQHLRSIDRAPLCVEGEVDRCAAVALDGLDDLEVVGAARHGVVRVEPLRVEVAHGEPHDVLDAQPLVDLAGEGGDGERCGRRAECDALRVEETVDAQHVGARFELLGRHGDGARSRVGLDEDGDGSVDAEHVDRTLGGLASTSGTPLIMRVEPVETSSFGVKESVMSVMHTESTRTPSVIHAGNCHEARCFNVEHRPLRKQDPAMTQRLNFAKSAPEMYTHLAALDTHIGEHIEHSLFELVKLRASMINGCAFCVDMHSNDALKAGDTTARLLGSPPGGRHRSTHHGSGRRWP